MDVGQYLHYWGKTNRSKDPNSDDYHLLPYHCLDVAACGYHMVKQNRFQAADILVSLGLEGEEGALWFAYFLALHDIGKFARGFQQLYPHTSPDLVTPLNGKAYTTKHDNLGYWLWQRYLRSEWKSGSLALFPAADDLSGTTYALDMWLQIVTGHHGKPPTPDEHDGVRAFDGSDKLAVVDYFLALKTIFPFETLPDCFATKSWRAELKQQSWLLAGLTVLADWLGSNQTYFPLCAEKMPLTDYWQAMALPKAEEAITQLPPTPDVLPFHSHQDLFPFIQQPTPLQQQALEQDLSSSGAQMFILEDVTGAGKTEAAMILAHRLMSEGKGKGIYLGLPTMATANAMYMRLATAYHALYQPHSRPSLILAHGARHMSEAFSQSVWTEENQGQENYALDEQSAGSECNRWFADSRKKALLADIGVGTLDQALMAALPFKHQTLRILGLCNKILILDEVHAYDAYMSRLLEKLIYLHASQGGSIIVLTATLPFSLREKLCNAFRKGCQGEMPTLNVDATYPWWTHLSAERVEELSLATREEVRRTVGVRWLTQRQQGITLIKQAVESGLCICWIINSVDDAIQLYQQLKQAVWMPNEDLLLFHSRFAFCDRVDIENKSLSWFGSQSSSETRKGRVLIATQVIEQSLDIDLDMMISDIAPVDLLIQRAGRLQRHIRDANGNRKSSDSPQPLCDERAPPELYVLAPEWSDTPDSNWINGELRNSGFVYADHALLWRTQFILRQLGHIKMPEEARALVDGVYEGDATIPTPSSLQRAEHNAMGKQMSERAAAEQNALVLDQGYCAKSSNTGWREEIEISTRLSEASKDLYFAWATEGEPIMPYAGEVNFPWEMSRVQVREVWWQNNRADIPLLEGAELEQLQKMLRRNDAVVALLRPGKASAFYSKDMGLIALLQRTIS